MPAVATFQRQYWHHPHGPEYPCQRGAVAAVLRSMNEAADGDVPFNVRFRLDDGTTVLAKPRGRR